jgi:hypothetical protein
MNYEGPNRTVRRKPEVRSEVRDLCSEVKETFGVLSLFGVKHCGYSKIESVISCSFAWRTSNKSNVKSRAHKLFVALPSKHATIVKHVLQGLDHFFPTCDRVLFN